METISGIDPHPCHTLVYIFGPFTVSSGGVEESCRCFDGVLLVDTRATCWTTCRDLLGRLRFVLIVHTTVFAAQPNFGEAAFQKIMKFQGQNLVTLLRHPFYTRVPEFPQAFFAEKRQLNLAGTLHKTQRSEFPGNSALISMDRLWRLICRIQPPLRCIAWQQEAAKSTFKGRSLCLLHFTCLPAYLLNAARLVRALTLDQHLRTGKTT